jgi:tetratricopeptide (TPR) repeat protein
MDYLEYAYLQVAQDREAKQIRDNLVAFQRITPEGLAAAYAIAAIPTRFALERRDWSEAVALAAPPFAFPWDRFPHIVAITSFGRALGAAHTGDIATAQNEVERLQSLHQVLLERRDMYWADQVEVQRLGAAGAVARAQGKDEEAVRLTRAAADLDSTMDKLNVTPAEVLPARELLADLLLDINQPAQALSEYERSLGMEPKRFRSLVGAARAAKMSGAADKARAFYTQIVDICSSASTERPELVEARAFVTQ